MARGVDDDFLSLEGGVEIGDDADLPARRVRLAARRQRERLGGRSVFAAVVEGAALELLGRLLVQLGAQGAGTAGPPGRDDDLSAGERVDAEVDAQLPSLPPPAARTSGPISSIGKGRISVDVRSELISSIVCR